MTSINELTIQELTGLANFASIGFLSVQEDRLKFIDKALDNAELVEVANRTMDAIRKIDKMVAETITPAPTTKEKK